MLGTEVIMLNKLNISPQRQSLIVYVVLVIVTLAVFWQVNQYDFVNFDDDIYLTENYHIKPGITLDGKGNQLPCRKKMRITTRKAVLLTLLFLLLAASGSAFPSSTYVVRKGDTLAKIARRCGVSVASLKKLNGLSSSTIMVGQTLVIRASRGGAPKVTPAPTPTIESSVSPW